MVRNAFLVMVCTAILAVVGSTISCGASQEMKYLNTKGEIVTDLGQTCTPTEQVSENVTIVYQKTSEDLQLFGESLKRNGVLDADERNRMVQQAAAADCERKSSKQCSSGTCSSGSCQLTSMGNSSFCRCR